MRSATLFSAALLAGAAVAAPAPRPGLFGDLIDKVKSTMFPSTISGTLDPALLPTITYYAEYAAAAYCDPAHVPGTEVTCKDAICPSITANTVFTSLEFAEGQTDTTGIVARDDTTRTIVVAFRGSHSVQNWLSNLAAGKVSVPWCAGCRAHSGFVAAWQEDRARILAAVGTLRAAYPDYGVATVGHSLGGALAQLAAADMRATQGLTVAAYTFGSPRIGNDALSKWISKQGPNYRVTHADDPVPRLPLMLMGYTHVSPEYHIAKGDDEIKAQDVNVLEGTVNFGGNTADDGVVSVDINAHLRYLLTPKMGACADAFFDGFK
ncbi:Alpha/Beta hydrolase protein [Geopyxis carbonaria]|nr:Alpha/Beta hydrolase protein [Geopyxis carbonaria]